MQMSSKASALVGQSLTSNCQREGNTNHKECIIRVEYHGFYLGYKANQDNYSLHKLIDHNIIKSLYTPRYTHLTTHNIKRMRHS
jgi:hypothetical protein